MEALLTSTLSVAIAEIGDKTQLLALLLICRFRKPRPIIAGMLAATLLNHAGAARIGEFISRWLDPKIMTLAGRHRLYRHGYLDFGAGQDG